jgi:flagellar biosynthesis protein FlhG
MVDGKSPDEPSARAPAPRGVRSVMAVTAGRGGAGSSSLAVNLAVYLAQLGRSVALVDSDPSGGQLHTMLGVSPPSPGGDDDERLVLTRTPVPGLSLVCQIYRVGTTVPVHPGRKPRWARHLRHLDVDYVLLDLGASTTPAVLDLCLGADLILTVTTPDPPSIEGTYRLVRALFQRRVRRTLVKDRFKIRMVERAQSDLPPLPSPIALTRTLGRYDTTAAELALGELSKLRPRLIVNGVRLRQDGDLGSAMVDMAERHLGVRLDYVGSIEQDDSVWLSVVRRRPLLIDSPASKSARNVERIARRLLALTQNREAERTLDVPLVPDEKNLYDVLLTHRGASDDELRRAYKRQRTLYQSGSLPLTSLISEAEFVGSVARIEEAHDTLLDPVRRRAYDLSMFPDDVDVGPSSSREVDASVAAERAMLREELQGEIHAETEFSGALLRKVRDSQGIDLEEIANRTKISVSHLRAIEAEDFEQLPATVYTRGFVQEIAKYLRLDPAQVTKTYLKRYRQWRHESKPTS